MSVGSFHHFTLNGQVMKRTDTPEQDARVLAVLRERGPLGTGLLARELGSSQATAALWLEDLQARGFVRAMSSAGGQKRRLTWELIDVRVDEALVRPALVAPILAAVAHSGELPSSLAARLGARVAEVRETCKALTVEGRLQATSIGATVVYQVPVATTFVDPEPAKRVTSHPEAILYDHLAQGEVTRRRPRRRAA